MTEIDNTKKSKTESEDERAKEARDFILTWAIVLIACPLISLIFHPDHMKPFFTSSLLQGPLLIAAIWTLCGAAAYMTIPFKEILLGRHTVKILTVFIFFAPTLLIFLFGPTVERRFNLAWEQVTKQLQQNSNLTYYDELQKKVVRDSWTPIEPSAPFVPSPDAKPVFFARHDIPRDILIPATSLVVKDVDLEDFPDAIIATKENYFGEPGSKESILSAKTNKTIKAGELIKQSDILQ